MYNSVKVEQIRYRGCLGLQKLCRPNKDAFIHSIKLCNKNKVYTFKACNNIFKELIKLTPDPIEIPIKNDNLRGESYYGSN